MGRNKSVKFAEFKSFSNAFENPESMKGNWNTTFFKNNNPITLELGCGKGEYTLALAELFPDKNFIGIDIKGARLWHGAKTALNNELKNTAFLRIQIENLLNYFNKNEVEEIWIPFPDPQLRERRVKKRITGALFLKMYKQILKKNGVVHLKTDNQNLYDFTLNTLENLKIKILKKTTNLYSESFLNEVISVKTTYEKKFIEIGSTIKYLKFGFSEL